MDVSHKHYLTDPTSQAGCIKNKIKNNAERVWKRGGSQKGWGHRMNIVVQYQSLKVSLRLPCVHLFLG